MVKENGVKIKNAFFVLLVMFISLRGNAQPNFSIPLKAGDIEVYTSKKYNDTSIVQLSIRAILNNDPQRNTYLNSIFPYHPIAPISNPGVSTSRVTSKGMFREQNINYQDPHDWDAYPLYIPSVDSMRMERIGVMWGDSVTFYFTRKFDTTVFNKKLNAYECLNQNRRFVVADTFGFVSGDYGSAASNIILSSAIVDGIRYNWDDRTWRMMPLCIGNIYQYFRTYIQTPPATSLIIEHIDRDTIINGQQYFIYEIDEKYFHNKYFLRESNQGIESNSSQSLFFPANAVPGRYCSNGMIADTMSVVFNGKMRRQIVTENRNTTHSYNKSLWIEGIGSVNRESFGFESSYTDSLTYASVCGEMFGTPVHVIEQQEILSQSNLYQNSPNPFSTSTNIRYTISQTSNVRIEIFDLLGRKIATLVDEEKDAGEYSLKYSVGRFADIRSSKISEGRSADLHPGIYFYRLSAGKNVVTKKMIVMN